MDPIAFFLIVISAVLHASWNLIAKKKSHADRSLYAALYSRNAALVECSVLDADPGV